MKFSIDKDIQGFMKGFSSGAGQFEDPTYLGFRLDFGFNVVKRNGETNFTDSALFSNPNNTEVDSAIRYLRTIGYTNKAAMLEKFKERFEDVCKNTPWYFQSIEGHKDLWKIEKFKDFNPQRGQDKELIVRCLESLDMKMTSIFELYRQATFDEITMKWLLPQNLRWFTCDLVIAEIRNFHKMSSVIQASLESKTTAETTQSGESNIQIDAGTLEPLIDPFISTIKFTLSHCEFDFEDSFFETVANNDDAEMAKTSFKIRIGKILQDSSYPVYGYRLRSSAYKEETINAYNDTAAKSEALLRAKAFTVFQTADPISTLPTDNIFKGQPEYPEQSLPAINNQPFVDPQLPGFSPGDNVFNGQSTNFNPILAAASSRVNDIVQPLVNAPANFVGQQINNFNANVTGAVLGNVYTNQNTNQVLQTAAQGLGNAYGNVVDAVNSLLGRTEQFLNNNG